MPTPPNAIRALCRLLGAASLLVICALAAAAAASGAARPLVKIVTGPSARTNATHATFRIASRATNTACRRDNLRYRRCGKTVKYTRLRPGGHVFTVRARNRGRTLFVRRRWTVLTATPALAAPAPVAPAAAAPQSGPAEVLPGAQAPVSGARRLLFADEFDGTTLDTSRYDVYNARGHAGYGLRRPSALALDGNGNLVITAKMVDGQLVSGGMGTLMNFTYGRIEFRVKTEPDPTGTMSGVVLTWPQEQWSPEFTENDMYETGPQADNRDRFSSYVHFGTANWQKWKTHDVDPSVWHTIAMEWYPEFLEIYIDGVAAFTITDPAVIPDIPHHVCMQLDARAAQSLTRTVRMTVDYVRVYQ
ncbi:MAG: hypothetical protein QOE31_3680 [Solirubrobacteraceae bacterium]|jgi:beta-glucanase (GH16 family)|nr:hypothetical protein [Solirubrobacteraceae bacterium]